MPLATSTTRSTSRNRRAYVKGARRYWVYIPPFATTGYGRSPTGPEQSRLTSCPRSTRLRASTSTTTSDPPALGCARSFQATNRISTSSAGSRLARRGTVRLRARHIVEEDLGDLFERDVDFGVADDA